MFDSDDDQSELKYLSIIRDIRDNHEKLYKKIKELPYKCKSARECSGLKNDSVLTFMRNGSLKKFFIASDDSARELLFFEAIKYLEVRCDFPKSNLNEAYYKYLIKNKNSFKNLLEADVTLDFSKSTNTGNDAKILKLLIAISKHSGFTDVEDKAILRLRELYDDGAIPSRISKLIVKETKFVNDPVKIYHIINKHIADVYFTDKNIGASTKVNTKSEIILSLFLRKEVCNE